MPSLKRTHQLAAEKAKERVRAQYGSVGDAYVRSAGHATGNDLARMVELAAPQSTDRVLDIATGGGHVAKAFAPHVAEVVFSDLTPEILEHAAAFLERDGIGNAVPALVDAEAIPYPDASFDIVTCRIAPHHFPNPDLFVQESARVLKSGGRFVLVDSTVPDGEIGTFFNAFELGRDPSHVRSLTISEWLDLITAAGLTPVHHETFRKRHDYADWTARSRMTDEARDALAQTMIEAGPEIRDTFLVEIENGTLIAFQDTKTLFLATKP